MRLDISVKKIKYNSFVVCHFFGIIIVRGPAVSENRWYMVIMHYTKAEKSSCIDNPNYRLNKLKGQNLAEGQNIMCCFVDLQKVIDRAVQKKI